MLGAPRPDDELQAAVSATPIIVHTVTNDVANVNECISDADEAACELAPRGTDKIRANVETHCQAHQGCFVIRPIYEGCGDYASIMVRLANMLSHQKAVHVFLESCDSIIERRYKHVQVLALPPGAQAWRERSEWIMRQTNRGRCALPEEDITEVLDVFNSSW